MKCWPGGAIIGTCPNEATFDRLRTELARVTKERGEWKGMLDAELAGESYRNKLLADALAESNRERDAAMWAHVGLAKLFVRPDLRRS